MSLRARLALVSSLALAVVLVLGGFGLESLFRAGLLREVDLSLQSVGELIARDIAAQSDDPFAPPRMEDLWSDLYGAPVVDKFVQLLDRDGKIDLRGGGRQVVPVPTSDAALDAAKDGRLSLETVKIQNVDLRVLTVPVFRRGLLRHLVQVGAPLTEMQQSVRTLRTVLIGVLPLLLVLEAFGAWWLAGRALLPVHRVTQEARSLTARSLNRRLAPLPVKDELGRLVDTLNEMIGGLESSFEVTRRFSADASHELRTPLTVLRGELELALRSTRTAEEYREVVQSCLEEVGKLTQIVDDLLFLSRTEGALRKLEPVDLNEVAAEVIASLMPLARERGLYLRLNLDSSGAVLVPGDAGQLGRMLRNLVENAVFYTPQGGVRVSVGRTGAQALLTVEDTGVGIAEEHQSRVFSRFYRVDFARSRAPGSSGLGLSIVKQVVEAHGGTVELQSVVGQGSTFRVYFPVVA
jgi:heavy metal sensor kinase